MKYVQPFLVFLVAIVMGGLIGDSVGGVAGFIVSAAINFLVCWYVIRPMLIRATQHRRCASKC